ncbi:hypothetical protein BH10BAC3_BH10BAC3_17490 [soil metagenome]
MKKNLLTIIYFLAYILSSNAQTLFGITREGGNGGGTIIKFLPATNNLTVAKSFESFAAYPYYTNFIQASNGKLYGMTSSGGNDSSNGSGFFGVIISFDPSTSTYTRLKAFDNTNGANPYGSLVQASNGKLYGMTRYGGSGAVFAGSLGNGVIFSFDPASSTYTKLKDFDGGNGANPYGSLVHANDGKLYGMTYSGGAGYGVIFSYDPSSSIYTRLKNFNNTDGANPYGDLVQANDGKLYGMTSAGGSGGYGVIFSFDPSSLTYTKLKDFDNSNGGLAWGNLVQAANGKLYGTTIGGGNNQDGVFFSFDPSSSTYTILKDFDSPNGTYPGSLMKASNGKLYGMTHDGGSSGGASGIIFSFDPSFSTYTKLKEFSGTDGGGPYGGLMEANDGKLYGLTTSGGGSSYGVIFSYDPLASIFTKLTDLDAADGRNPYCTLLHASDGKLYGMTIGGGSSPGGGVIFSYNPSTSVYTKLWDFDFDYGRWPFGSLMQASNGKLYGTTFYGGGDNIGGVIFSFDPSTSTYTKLKGFAEYVAEGEDPGQGLVQASNGKLYGTTQYGGSAGNGVIFSFDPSTSVYTKLRDFDWPNGGQPWGGSMMQASNGKLYGVTARGGTGGYGVIYSFDPVSSTYTKLKDFDNAIGEDPHGSLIQSNDGKLYGMAGSGGSGGYGVIFSFDPSGGTYIKLHDFDGINGAYPLGSLMQSSDGKLYGMTLSGGNKNYGVVFSFDPSTSVYTKLKDFDGTNGANPWIGAGFIEFKSGALPVTLVSLTAKNIGSSNQLIWKVENEQNLNLYELQRSIDGRNFTRIAQINATGNNSYTYNDQLAAPISSVYYYRLKNVDKDGKFTYSEIVHLNIATTSSYQFSVAPNPFSNSTIISFSLAQSANASIKIFDMAGRLIKILANTEIQQGTHQLTWNAKDEKGNTLSAGMYLVQIQSGNYTEAKRLSLLK